MAANINNPPQCDWDAFNDHVAGAANELRRFQVQLEHEPHRQIIEMLRALTNRFTGLENRFDRLENRFDRLENRFDRLENRFDRLENRTAAINYNNIARFENSQIEDRDTPLVSLHAVATNTPIPNFPTTSDETINITIAAINPILAALELPGDGRIADKRARLRRFMGLRPERLALAGKP